MLSEDVLKIGELLKPLRTIEHHMAAFHAVYMMENEEYADSYYGHFLSARINAQCVPIPFKHTIKRPIEGLMWPTLHDQNSVWFYTHPARRQWAGMKFPAIITQLNHRGGWFDDVKSAVARDLWHSVNEECPGHHGIFFRVHADYHDTCGIQVYGCSIDAALDDAADYWSEMGWEGHFMDDKMVAEYKKDGCEDSILYLGNEGLPVLGDNLIVTPI
jgi:hypothetical protein